MRTTIILGDDVAISLKRLEKARGIKFKALVNEALRAAINPWWRHRKGAVRFALALSTLTRAGWRMWTMLPKFLPSRRTTPLNDSRRRYIPPRRLFPTTRKPPCSKDFTCIILQNMSSIHRRRRALTAVGRNFLLAG